MDGSHEVYKKQEVGPGEQEEGTRMWIVLRSGCADRNMSATSQIFRDELIIHD